MSDRGRQGSAYDGGVRWVRVSKGLYLVGFGTFLLLTTQGLLPPSFWAEALAYWPVLLLAAGVRLVFERSSLPWVVLLGPSLVLGTLMHVALREPGRAGAMSEWVPLRVDRPADLAEWTLEGRLALASLDVTARRLPRGVLVDGRATESGSRSLRLAEDASAGRVRLTNTWTRRTFIVVPGRHRARGELNVATGLPVAFDLDLALTTTRLDVAAGAVSRVAFDGAFNDLTLRLGEPSSDVRLDLEGAFNQVTIEVPAHTPVRLSREGFLNVVDGRRRARGEDSGRAGGGVAGDPGYRVRLEGAFNRVMVRSW